MPALRQQTRAVGATGAVAHPLLSLDHPQVEFFAPVEAAKKEVEEVLAVGQGSGTKLRDIPNIAYKMGKLTGRDELIEGLHNVLFRRKGAVSAGA